MELRVPLRAHRAVALAREMAVAHALADGIARELAHGPHGHGAHERGGIAKQRLDLAHEALIARVAGGNQHVAQEAVAARAFDWRAGETVAKGAVVEREQLAKRRVVGFGSRRQSAPLARLPRTCSTGTRRDSRRNRTRGCPWAGGTRPGCAPCARSIGTRGSDAHRARRAPGTRASGTRRGSGCSSRSGLPPARRERSPRSSGWRRGTAKSRPRARRGWCACPASRCRRLPRAASP